jgi:hypothetical protein
LVSEIADSNAKIPREVDNEAALLSEKHELHGYNKWREGFGAVASVALPAIALVGFAFHRQELRHVNSLFSSKTWYLQQEVKIRKKHRSDTAGRSES